MQQLPMGDALLPRHDARGLTAGGNLAAICLDGQTYTLRITRQGKLILTK
ncbi:hemin uptake protein HemP [Paracoccus suum]|nr:hemin uptake protein HemP [Paracoccus suum]